MKLNARFFSVLILGIIGVVAANAWAGSIAVNSADDIYGAGQSGTPGVTAASVGSPGCAGASTAGIPCGGYIPARLAVSGGETVTFSSVTGSVTLDDATGSYYNNANGGGAAPSTSSNTGANGISGIAANGAGYLVGVFLAAGGPSGTTPSALDYLSSSSIDSPSVSPLLDQVFFIGDGNNAGLQDFVAPSGAGALYLGISDACGYNGAPSCYNDNLSNFTVNYEVEGATTSAVPEPSSLWLLGSGVLGLASMARRKFGLRA